MADALTDGPCQPWADLGDLCAPCNDYSGDEAILLDALAAASSVLYKLSGRQYPGVCSEEVIVGDPCRCAVSARYLLRSWRWGNRRPCKHDRVRLRGWPVVSIESVTIDGVDLGASEYQVEDFAELVRVDGTAWPAEFNVAYSFGQDPPQEGVTAAAVLACELAKACDPDGIGAGSQCRLPKRVQSVTRQGVSMVFLDPFDFLNEGKTGLYEVDQFLKSANPNGLQQRPYLWSPDLGPPSRRVTIPPGT